MSKDERTELFNRASANGWNHADLMVAYFEATVGMPEELERMANNKPETEPDEPEPPTVPNRPSWYIDYEQQPVNCCLFCGGKFPCACRLP